MDIRFTKPELDFGAPASLYGSDLCTVTISAWYGSEKFSQASTLPARDVGSERWPYLLHDMHLELTRHILKRYPPREFTITQRR